MDTREEKTNLNFIVQLPYASLPFHLACLSVNLPLFRPFPRVTRDHPFDTLSISTLFGEFYIPLLSYIPCLENFIRSNVGQQGT